MSLRCPCGSMEIILKRIDKTSQNSKCRLCDDRNETINYKRIQQISTEKV